MSVFYLIKSDKIQILKKKIVWLYVVNMLSVTNLKIPLL